MTTLTNTGDDTSPSGARSRAARSVPSTEHRVSFPRLLRSEWIKVTSLRSTWWSLFIAAALTVGFSAMASASIPAGYPPVMPIVGATQFTMLIAGILGAIVITGEYSTGMIRSTLTAEPRRGAVVMAKAVVIGALMAVTTVVIYAVAIAVSAPMVSEQIDWSQPKQSIVPLAFGVMSMVCFTLLGLGFGFLIRNGAGAIAATVGVLFVLPVVGSLFALAGESWKWVLDAADYLPLMASQTVMSPGAEDLLPSALALVAWAVVPLVAGWAVLRSRDA